MLLDGRRLVERATRWLCRARARTEIDVTQTAHHFEAGVRELYDAVPEMLTTSDRQAYETRLDELTEAGVPGELARRVAAMPALCRCSTSWRTRRPAAPISTRHRAS